VGRIVARGGRDGAPFHPQGKGTMKFINWMWMATSAGALVLAGCGGDSGTTSSGTGTGTGSGTGSGTGTGTSTGTGTGTSTGTGTGTSTGTGTGTSTGMPVDECAQGTDNCDANATCTDTADGFTCDCNMGYTGDGVTCTDTDECTDGTDTCDANATCTNTPGSFTCACNMGYSGDGMTCTDVDECTAMTDTCDANATCTNTPGSYTCACNMGYSGDGMTCMDVDECATNTDTCDANATCTNTPGSFTCMCDMGYSGDGMTCTDVDECTAMTDNCDANATCTNTPGSFTCMCNSGYIGNGQMCTLEGDTCMAPKVIGSVPYSDTDDTSTGFTDALSTGGGCSGDGGVNKGAGTAESIYEFTPATSGTYRFALTKSNNSGPSIMYLATNCGNVTNTCVTSSGDIWGQPSGFMDVPLTGGTTYYLAIDGWYTGEDGSYTLDVNEVVTTTVSASALGLTTPAVYDGTTSGMACAQLNFADAGTVVSIDDATIGVTSNWVGDNAVKLFSPSNTILSMLSFPGVSEPGDQDGICSGDSSDLSSSASISFADGYANDAETMGSTITSSQTVCVDDGQCQFFPNPDVAGNGTDFGDFAGESVNGNWQLCVGDACGGSATLDSASVTITYVLQ